MGNFKFNPFTKKLDEVDTGGGPPGSAVTTLSSEGGPATPPTLADNFNFSGSLAGGSAANGAIQFTTPGGPGAATNGQMDAVVLTDGTTIHINASNQLEVVNGVFGETITGDTGGPLSPSLGNWNIFGGTLSAGLNATTTSGSGSTLTITSINCSKWIVDPVANRGTHQTIAGAIAAASSGDVIFVKPGNYLENVTINKSLQFFSFSTRTNAVSLLPQIAGTITISGAGAFVGFTGFSLTTNGATCLAVTGASANVMINSCVIGALDGTGIAITGDSTTNVNLNGCYGGASNGSSLFTTTNGNITFQNCIFKATASGFATSTTSAGTVSLFNSQMLFPITTSSTGVIFAYNSQFGALNGGINITNITTAGTATTNKFVGCAFYSGTASAVSIGASTAVTMINATCESSNANVLTGAGTLNYAFITFSGSSSGHNVTVETPLNTLI